MFSWIIDFFSDKRDAYCFNMIRKHRLALWYDYEKKTWVSTTETVQIRHTQFNKSPVKAIKNIVKSMENDNEQTSTSIKNSENSW